MMHGREKSDSAIVAGKPTNKAVPTAAEPVERRAGAKGNAHQQSTHWTQRQARATQALERIRQAFAVIHPRWESYARRDRPGPTWSSHKTASERTFIAVLT